MNSTEPITYFLPQADHAGKIFSNFFLALAGCFFFISQIWIASLRGSPLLHIRCPSVFAFDIGLNFLNCVYQCLINVNFYFARTGCEPLACISDGFELCSTMALIGRAVLFYNQAANINKGKKNPTIDKIMDIFAWFTAPGDYFRNKNLRKIARNVVINPNIQKNKTIFEEGSTTLAILYSYSTSGGFTRYVITTIIWFFIGAGYSITLTSRGLGTENLFSPSISDSSSCWALFVQPVSLYYYFVIVIIFLFLTASVWNLHDNVGLRDDIVLCLIIFAMIKLFIAVTISALANTMAWEYSFPLSFFPPFISFSVFLYYIYFAERFGNTTVSKLNSLVDEDVELSSTFELRRAIMYMKGLLETID
jgi:hypothetical protein